MSARNPLPREIAPGVYWLGDCVIYHYETTPYHAYSSTYLVTGSEASLLVEAGHPRDLPLIEEQLDQLFAKGVAPLRYIFPTHQETPHAGGVGRLLAGFPDSIVCGDTSDYHLVFPQYADRMRRLAPGGSIDLGGTEFLAVESVFRDYLTTLWGFDTSRRVLFPGDGFAYSHYHTDGQCGKFAEEVPALDLVGMTSMFAEFAFYWTHFVDLDPYVERLAALAQDELGAKVIAPTHGLPLKDLDATLPKIWDGLRAGGASEKRNAILK